ncbi:MAG: hypothetical protein MUF62_07800 [Chitinophagaceae bacterium]|nr:hypothetical protein [Chitinophagaceae bacterium]
MRLPDSDSKVALSDAEWQLAQTPAFILTKNRVIDAVGELFGELADDYRQLSIPLVAHYPAIFNVIPKVSKGEKYEHMPWVMLDYPRNFGDQEGHFAIRSFFWWGHGFSIRLQLSGSFLHRFYAAFAQLEQQGFICGITNNPWDQQLPPDHWQRLSDMDQPVAQYNQLYAIAGKKIPVDQWPQVKSFYTEQYRLLVAALAAAG